MLHHPTDIVSSLAGVAAAVAATGLAWVAGSCLAPTRPSDERLAAGMLVLIGASGLLIAQPLIGWSLLAHPWLLRLLLVAGVGAAVWWRRPPLTPLPRPTRRWLAVAAVGLLVSFPILAAQSLDVAIPGGDIAWHEGWIRQLRGGVLEPVGLYAGVPSAYPWLYHALLGATFQVFGLSMATGLITAQALGLVLLALGIWLFCREAGLNPPAGTWGACLAIAGCGPAVLLVSRARLLDSPSPLTALANLPPLLPRDLGIALMGYVLWLGLRAARSGSLSVAAACGAVAGLIVLSSPLALVPALGAALAMALVHRRWRAAAVEPAAGAGVALIWVAPLWWHAHRLGGLRNTTAPHLTDPPRATSLVGLGVLAVLAVAGLVIARRRDRIDSLALGIPIAVAAAAWLGSVSLSGPVGGSMALTRGVRALPPVSLALVAPAGLALAEAVQTAGRRAGLAVTVVASIVLFSSTAAAAWTLRDHLDRRADAPVLSCPALDVRAGDTIAVLPARRRGQIALQMALFQRTGAYLYYAERPRVRFKSPHTADQSSRLRTLHGLELGGPVPPGIDALVTLDRTADPACAFRGHPLSIRLP